MNRKKIVTLSLDAIKLFLRPSSLRRGLKCDERNTCRASAAVVLTSATHKRAKRPEIGQEG